MLRTMRKKLNPKERLRQINASRLLDAAVIEEEMKIYSMSLDELPLTSALDAYLQQHNPVRKRGQQRFSTGDWLMSLEDEYLGQLIEAMSIGLYADRHDPQYRTQINELYHITWYLLAAEKGKRIRGNKIKIGMDSKRFARHLEEVVEYVGKEIARRKGWILVEGKYRLLGDKKPQIVVTPKGAKECPELLES